MMDFDDDEDDDDIDESDDDSTIDCPYCGEPVYDDAERCPHCDQYLSDFDAPRRRKPWWLIAGVIVCLYLVYRWTLN